MSYYFVNQRKNNIGEWEPLETAENITISTTYPYIAQLSERPASGLDVPSTQPPSISGMTITENGNAIGETEFYVNYQTGILTFNSVMSGQSVVVDYWALGSVISSDEINILFDRLVHFTRNPTTNDVDYEIGTIWVSTVSNDYGTVKRFWILTDIIDSDAIWKNFSDSISSNNVYGEITSVTAFSDGRIEFKTRDDICCYFNSSGDLNLIGNLVGGEEKTKINFTQTPPTSTSDPSGDVGEIRFIYDEDIPVIYMKNAYGWFKIPLSSF